jgi:DNA polymerase V
LFERFQEDVATAVKQEINLKHGRFAVRCAATLAPAPICADAANAYDNCDMHGKMCF